MREYNSRKLAIGWRACLALLVLVAIVSCAGSRPAQIGTHGSTLRPCPPSPNCVSSDATDEVHGIAAIELVVPADRAWRAVIEVVAARPRTEIVSQSERFLHAECKSALLGFVDDLELQLRPAQNEIAVRSSSRLGYGDLGVNRKRVEAIRSALVERGVSR